MKDFQVENHGSVFTLEPQTPAGESWAEEYLPEDAPMMCGRFVVEHRFIRDIVEGILNDGLTVE
jgi:hypothetical protein